MRLYHEGVKDFNGEEVMGDITDSMLVLSAVYDKNVENVDELEPISKNLSHSTADQYQRVYTV